MAALVAAALCFFCVAVCAQQTKAGQHFARAVQLHQSGDFQGAITEYQACLELEPDRIDALSNLGAALAHLGRYREAITQYLHALKLSGGDARIRINLALAYYKSDQLPEAIQELSGLYQSSPGNEQILLLLSDCYLRQGENKKVIDLLKPVASADNRAVTYLLGTALIRDNQIAEGQALIERLLRSGESAETALLIGTAQSMGGQYVEATQTLARAVALNAELSGVFAAYGLALLKAGDAAAAENAFRRELERDPANYEVNLNLGMMLRARGKLDEAAPLLTKAREIRPRDSRAGLEIALLHLAQGHAQDAATELEDAVHTNPDLAAGHRALADAYTQLKRTADATRELEIAQQLERQAQSGPAIEKLHREVMEKLKAQAE